MKQHWGHESNRVTAELRGWQDFRVTQQRIREDHPDRAREEDMERQRYPHDPQLTASLKKLTDWKEYQAYFQRGVDLHKKQIKGIRRAVEAIERNDPRVERSAWGEEFFRGASQGRWVKSMQKRREGQLAPEEKRLEWVKQQLPAVLSECAALLMGAPTSRRAMEERSELEAKRVYNTLRDTGGRPSRPIQPVPDVHDGEHTDEHLRVLCHWEGEHGQFEEELREWKEFLDHQQKKEADREAEAGSLTQENLRKEYRTYKEMEMYNAKQWLEFWQRRQSTESPAHVTLWKEYRSYQQLEVENAKQWVEFWQRQVKYFQQHRDNCIRQGLEGLKGEAQRNHSQSEELQPYVEDARKQVRPAEMRLEWVEQQLAALLAECAVSRTEVSTSNHLEDQARPPRASWSGQTTLKDLRSNRSGRSALRSHPKSDIKKNRPSANSALGPIHSSKVAKAAGRKTPRPSRIPAKRDDGQNQGLNITISPPPPANTQPQPTEVMLRRSDRILKQKERMSTSTSSAALTPSKPKGRVADTKPDRTWGKPRGIPKRRGRDLSLKRTKIHT